MTLGFPNQLAIQNRALQHCGARRILALDAVNRRAAETTFIYDKLRRAELRRSVWTFATRRAVLREATATSKLITPAVWAIGTTYVGGAVVLDPTDGVTCWISRQGSNLAHTPAEGIWWTAYFGPMWADAWSNSIAYLKGDAIYLSTTPYVCILGHTNQTPPNATYWAPMTGATLSVIVDASPAGLTSVSVGFRKRYYLPAGFIRLSPQDAKKPGTSRNDVSAEGRYHDWEIENGAIYTTDTSPLIFRFVADHMNVANMDDMFCEALAARIGLEVVVPLTNNLDKKKAIAATYAGYLQIAREQNAIEFGSTDTPENPEEDKAGGQ